MNINGYVEKRTRDILNYTVYYIDTLNYTVYYILYHIYINYSTYIDMIIWA